MALSQVGLERLNTDTTNKIGVDKNLIINGEFIVDQRMGGALTAITPSGGVDYTCDRWHSSNNSGEAARISFQTVSGDTPNSNYRQSIKLDCTTAMGSPSGNNWMGFCQFIESQNIRFLGHGTSTAKPITLQFWVKSTKTGTATVQLLRHDASREYLAEYTINASNTWEKKTITIPGDTSGTEAAFDNGRGFKLCFVLFAGSDRHGTVNNWRAQNGGYFGASANQVNLLDSTSNNIFFTGIQLEEGTEPTGFQHRSISSELKLCKRYFNNFGATTATGTSATYMLIAGGYARFGSANSIALQRIFYDVEMRANPTVTYGRNSTNDDNNVMRWSSAGSNPVVLLGSQEGSNQCGFNLTRYNSDAGQTYNDGDYYAHQISKFTANAEL